MKYIVKTFLADGEDDSKMEAWLNQNAESGFIIINVISGTDCVTITMALERKMQQTKLI